MKVYTSLLSLSLIGPAASASILGVDPALISKYNQDTFVCDDGISFPANVINDDYCDCYDGTDEPGTSACPNSHFYCQNTGHIPAVLKSHQVNDGICDSVCCDGSDESIKANCPNICNKQAMEYQLEVEADKEKRERANIYKKEYLAFAKEAKVKRTEDIVKFKNEISNLQKQIDKMAAVKDEAQKFHDKFQDQETKLDKLKREQECPGKLAASESALSDLKSKAERLAKQLANLYGAVNIALGGDRHGESDEEEDNSGDDESLPHSVPEACRNDPALEEVRNQLSLIDTADFNTREEESAIPESHNEKYVVDPCIDPDESLAACLKKGLSDGKENVLGLIHWNGWEKISDSVKSMIGVGSTFSTELALLLKNLDAAKQKLNEFQSKRDEMDKQLKELETIQNIDFGPSSIFAKLYDMCIELDTHEYIYELCFFKQATQKPKNGGSNTSIGKFSRWGTRYDSSNIKYDSMMYLNGVSCWNGPQRSVEVLIECGIENQILSVSEPSKCEYQMSILSPAACKDEDGSQPHHEEL